MSPESGSRLLATLRSGLAGRYEIEREVGTGGMAVVYLARDLRNASSVALKVLRSEFGQGMGPERFQREIQLAAALVHPRILSLLESGETAGLLWYTMPFIAGETLRVRLDREQLLPVEDAIELTQEVADALSYAHSQGVLHRDIKPANILLADGHALVADFGVARAIGVGEPARRLTLTGFSVGTPAYMSPEQASGERDLDARSDLYALACVSYEMLTGAPPFASRTPQVTLARRLSQPLPPVSSARPPVPEHLEAALRKALAPNPEDRYPNVKAFARALAGEAAPVAQSGWRKWFGGKGPA